MKARLLRHLARFGGIYLAGLIILSAYTPIASGIVVIGLCTWAAFGPLL